MQSAQLDCTKSFRHSNILQVFNADVKEQTKELLKKKNNTIYSAENNEGSEFGKNEFIRRAPRWKAIDSFLCQ